MGRKKAVKPEEVKKEEIVQKPKAYDMFARKPDRGFTAMTKEASMMADESYKERKVESSKKLEKYIHKIRKEE